MKKRLLRFMLAAAIVVGSCHMLNIPIVNTVYADVYYSDTGWIDMGRVDSQTWYEYFISCYQSGLHSSKSDVYKLGQFCIDHPEMSTWDSNAIAKAAREEGVIGTPKKLEKAENKKAEQKQEDTSIDSNKDSKVKPSISLNNYETTASYIVVSKKAVYSTYESGREEIGSISKGTEITVKGESSNGFYLIDYKKEDGSLVDGYVLFKGKDNIVSKEEYDAAWAESNKVEPTCEKNGYIEYINSLDGSVKKESIEAIGHVTSEESKFDTKKQGIFKDGKISVYCDKCGKVADTKVIDSYYKQNPAAIIISIVSGVVIAFGLLFIIAQNIKRGKNKELVLE